MYSSTEVSHVDLRIDDGEELLLGDLRLEVLHTPGHTSDSMCLVAGDRVFTRDTLLIQSTGRTDLPTGDPAAMHASLFDRILALDDRLQVFPAHDYKGRSATTIGAERASNPRLQLRDVDAFMAQMQSLSLSMPVHLTEALRVNRTGGKSVAQMIEETTRAVPFMSVHELGRRLHEGARDLTILDVRERDAYEGGHLPEALHLARGQVELRIDDVVPDPATRLVAYCDLGKISTLAVATLRAMGYLRAVALDGGLGAWREAGLPLVTSASARNLREPTAGSRVDRLRLVARPWSSGCGPTHIIAPGGSTTSAICRGVVPIWRSSPSVAFCHGDLAAVTTSSTPRTSSVRRNRSP